MPTIILLPYAQRVVYFRNDISPFAVKCYTARNLLCAYNVMHISKNLLIYFSTTNRLCDFTLVKCFVILPGLLFSSLVMFIIMSKNRTYEYIVSLCFTKVCYILFYSTCYKCATVNAANIVLQKLTNDFVYNTGY